MFKFTICQLFYLKVMGDSSGEVVMNVPADDSPVLSDKLESQVPFQKTTAYKNYCDVINIDDSGDSQLEEDPFPSVFTFDVPDDEMPIAEKK